MNFPFDTIVSVALLALGFGFVIFWHELGHFLAAKWAGVRVEQFAVGFAHAVLAWRKGVGVRVGSTQKEYRARILSHLGLAADLAPGSPDYPSERKIAETGDAIGLGETEYRLNWLPLGGYVKMLGQDDLRPNSEAEDPKAYNRQSIGKRMVIVSAGVVMNVILAAVGFVILFSMGFHVPPTKVGSVLAGSPAQRAVASSPPPAATPIAHPSTSPSTAPTTAPAPVAPPTDDGIRVGDVILELDGKPQYGDWTKIQLNAALAASNQGIPVKVLRTDPDGKQRQVLLTIKPQKADAGGATFVGLGIGPFYDLSGPKPEKKGALTDAEKALLMAPDARAINPGDQIIAAVIDGKIVPLGNFTDLDKLVQQGRPVELVVKRLSGAEERVTFTPGLMAAFGAQSFDLLGLVPRQQIMAISPDSPVKGKVLPNDVLLEVSIEGTQDPTPAPSFTGLKTVVNAAAAASKNIHLKLLRDGATVEVADIKPTKIKRDTYGLGVGPAVDETAAVVSEVTPGTPAAAAGIPPRSSIVKVGQTHVKNWNEVHIALRELARAHPAGFQTTVDVMTDGQELRQGLKLTLSEADAQTVMNVRYAAGLALEPTIEVRKADGIGQAVGFGLIETRDFILQFYVTLKRMVTGDVSPANLMGPVGIFQTGTTFASRGTDWLVWFLSMISANLAVVNFLPIPIVDGGLFTFLLIEKIKGKPASPRVQAVAQYVGLALLLSVFVFVTYQDLANFAFR